MEPHLRNLQGGSGRERAVPGDVPALGQGLTVKKEARAVQKVWRSYKGQLQKLLGKNMVGWFRELFVLVLHAVL